MGEESQITIKLKPVTGEGFSVEISPTSSIADLKSEICKTYDASVEDLRLIYKGMYLTAHRRFANNR